MEISRRKKGALSILSTYLLLIAIVVPIVYAKPTQAEIDSFK